MTIDEYCQTYTVDSLRKQLKMLTVTGRSSLLLVVDQNLKDLESALTDYRDRVQE